MGGRKGAGNEPLILRGNGDPRKSNPNSSWRRLDVNKVSNFSQNLGEEICVLFLRELSNRDG